MKKTLPPVDNIFQLPTFCEMLVFWDIDGTLMSCGSDGTKALNKTFLELYGVEDAFRKAGVGNAMDFTVLRRIAAQCGIVNFDADALESAYVSNLERILDRDGSKRVMPGVIALLDYVRGRDGWMNLLLTSNLRTGAEAKLRSVGLWSYFDGTCKGGFGDDSGEKWDAARAAIEEVAALMGTSGSPRDVVIIGDSVYDIHCAKRLGARHIAVASGFTAAETLAAEEPEYLFDDLSDTARVITALNGARVDSGDR
jgi:phosphoglycolate phosphatase-like HAD superfamily hydrolase